MTNETMLLQQAAEELRQLRKQNEIMSARLEMFDKCMLLLHTPPSYQNQGMSPDLVWEIEKHLSEQKDK